MQPLITNEALRIKSWCYKRYIFDVEKIPLPNFRLSFKFRLVLFIGNNYAAERKSNQASNQNKLPWWRQWSVNGWCTINGHSWEYFLEQRGSSLHFIINHPIGSRCNEEQLHSVFTALHALKEYGGGLEDTP